MKLGLALVALGIGGIVIGIANLDQAWAKLAIAPGIVGLLFGAVRTVVAVTMRS